MLLMLLSDKESISGSSLIPGEGNSLISGIIAAKSSTSVNEINASATCLVNATIIYNTNALNAEGTSSTSSNISTISVSNIVTAIGLSSVNSFATSTSQINVISSNGFGFANAIGSLISSTNILLVNGTSSVLGIGSFIGGTTLVLNLVAANGTSIVNSNIAQINNISLNSNGSSFIESLFTIVSECNPYSANGTSEVSSLLEKIILLYTDVSSGNSVVLSYFTANAAFTFSNFTLSL